MGMYRCQPQAKSHVYRSVLLGVQRTSGSGTGTGAGGTAEQKAAETQPETPAAAADSTPGVKLEPGELVRCTDGRME